MYSLILIFVCSGVLDQGSSHAEAQSWGGSLHPYSLPVALGHHQQNFPARHNDEISADR